jgi:hypothetical protein
MKKKMKRNLLLIFTLVFSLCVFSDTVNAQGLYKNKAESEEESASSKSGFLRGGPPTSLPEPGDPDASPIGEGLGILSILSAGYAIIKKRNIKKQKR